MQVTTLSFENMHNHGELFANMLRARHKTFIEHRNWDLPEANGMEFDQYDTPASRWIAVHEFGRVLAGVRLTPTTARCGIYSYMIRDAQLGLLDSIPSDLLFEEAPVGAHIWESSRVFVSPLARRMAEEIGINLSEVKGSGENGRVIKRDIENYTPGASSPATAAKFVPAGQEDFEEKPNSQMRKVIAKRLAESKFTAPHYYLNVEFDMANAIAFREQFNTIPDTKISYNDMIVKACALALKLHPQVNSQWFADKMRLNNHVHIGVAVAVEDGLVVPVVKFANEQSLPQIGAAVRDFAKRSRNKKLTPQEMEGSTFTVSNLGMFGIESFTSIINQPNSAILSVGAILEKPVVKNGQVVAGHTMKLSLACDHRTVDGATGAEFLQTLKGFIENPVTMLV